MINQNTNFKEGKIMERKNYLLGSILVIISAMLWGIDGVLLTPRLYNLPTTTVVLILHLMPFILMSIFFYKEYKNLGKFQLKDYIGFGLIGLFGGALGTLAIVKAFFLVNFQQLTVVVFLQKLQPVFAIILAKIILRERLGKNFGIWAVLALIGSYGLTFGLGLPHFKVDNYSLAAFYSITAAFSFGASTVFGKFVLQKWNFRTALFYRYGFTTVIMVIIIALSKDTFAIKEVTKNNWIIFTIITFTTGALAIALYYYGLKFISAHVSTICELAFPITSATLDYFINHTHLTIVQVLSAILMFLSIYRISRIQSQEA